MSASKAASNFWVWAGAITLVRVILLPLTDGGLAPDEAQYWVWAQSLDWGYFSKPPMIAWLIAATTGLFGDGAWAVRLAAPLLHGGTACFIFLSARALFDERIGFFSGLAWLTMPGVAASSVLITTDAPLLFFWSAALFFLIRIHCNETLRVTDFATLGVMLGLGLLSKYAMLYFLPALGLALALSPQLRLKLFRPGLALTAAIAALLFLPNILWNAAHDFETVSHTAANAKWGASLFHPSALGEFLASQFAVFGPVLFAALLAALSAKKIREDRGAWILLAAFAATPLIIVSVQALLSRANANWAAATYPAGVILATAYLFEIGRAYWAKASLAINGVAAFMVAVGLTNFALLDALGAGRAVAELRGWKEMTQQVADAYDAGDFDSILFDDRSMIGEMLYYQRTRDFEIAALDPNSGIDHFFEATMPFDPARHKQSLLVSILPTDAHVNYRFSNIERKGDATGEFGAGREREFSLFAISGHHPPTPRKKN